MDYIAEANYIAQSDAAIIRAYSEVCDLIDSEHLRLICGNLGEEPEVSPQNTIPDSPEQDSNLTAIEPNNIPSDIYTFPESVDFSEKDEDATTGENIKVPAWLRIPEEFRLQQNEAFGNVWGLSVSEDNITILWKGPDGITDLSFVYDSQQNEEGYLGILRPADYLTGDGEKIQVISSETLRRLYSIDASDKQFGIGTFAEDGKFSDLENMPEKIQEMIRERYPDGYIDSLDNNGVLRRYRVDSGLIFRVNLIFVVGFDAFDIATGRPVPWIVEAYPSIDVGFLYGLEIQTG